MSRIEQVQVSAWEASDGVVHLSESDAEEHQFKIPLQTILAQHMPPTLTPKAVIELLSAHREELKKVFT